MNDDKYRYVRAVALRQLLIDTASDGTSSFSTHRVRRRVVGGAAVCVLTLGLAAPFVIGAIDTGAQPAVQQSEASSEMLPLPAQTFVGDYEPFVSPSDMAEGAPVVFSGVVRTVTTVSELTGISATMQFGEVAILVLDDVQVAQGSLDSRADGSVLFALQGYRVGADFYSLAALKELFPPGSGVVTYGQRGWVADNQWGVSNVPPAAAHPAEQPLYTLWSPQGFVVQLPGSGLVQWPYVGAAQPGSLIDTLPEGGLIGIE